MDKDLNKATRRWTGRLWTDEQTTDGRRVVAGALTTDAVVVMAGPLALMDYPSGRGAVGMVDAVGELDGVGVGTGRTNLPPGEYAVAIDLADIDAGYDGDVMVIESARLAGVTLAVNPAWPDAMIVVHPNPGDTVTPPAAAPGWDSPMDERLRALTCKGVGHDVDTLREQIGGALELLHDVRTAMRPQLTEAEQRALDASAELANAMRALMPGIGENDQADHDWNEVALRIHDVQARIMAIAGGRTGLPCRPLGGRTTDMVEWRTRVQEAATDD